MSQYPQLETTAKLNKLTKALREVYGYALHNLPIEPHGDRATFFEAMREMQKAVDRELDKRDALKRSAQEQA